jgi:hypothetical protein
LSEKVTPMSPCTPEQEEQLRRLASSTGAGIWSIKRAKVVLGALEGKSIDRLVLDVRVPPRSIEMCLERFAAEGMEYFTRARRVPTAREAEVERILNFLDHPPSWSSSEWDALTHRYIGIHFSARQIRTIRELIASNPGYSRNSLARELCALFSLYQPNGQPRETTVSQILKRMDMDNIITLPARPKPAPSYRPGHLGGPGRSRGSHRKDTPDPVSDPPSLLELSSGDIEELRFIPAGTREELHVWNEMIRRYHYIKGIRLFGPAQRYLVYGGKREVLAGAPGMSAMAGKTGRRPASNGHRPQPAGGAASCSAGARLLAVLGFGASTWRLSCRDDFIGWSDEQRLANLPLVVNNARFLILPWIKSPNLASRILSGIARQLPQDWEERYNYRPVLLETFVQLDRFTGACYKAANWIPVGATSGYSLYGQDVQRRIPCKGVFVYPLIKTFRAVLCSRRE